MVPQQRARESGSRRTLCAVSPERSGALEAAWRLRRPPVQPWLQPGGAGRGPRPLFEGRCPQRLHVLHLPPAMTLQLFNFPLLLFQVSGPPAPVSTPRDYTPDLSIHHHRTAGQPEAGVAAVETSARGEIIIWIRHAARERTPAKGGVGNPCARMSARCLARRALWLGRPLDTAVLRVGLPAVSQASGRAKSSAVRPWIWPTWP